MSHSSKNTETTHPTQTIQDYLMLMHVLERDHGEIVASWLVEQ